MARLELRRRLYYAIRDVPKDVQTRLRTTRWVKSTGTGDREKAKRVAATYDVLWLEQIERARTGPRDTQVHSVEQSDFYERAAFWRDRIAIQGPESRDRIIELMKDEASLEVDGSLRGDDEDGVRRGNLFVQIALGNRFPLRDYVEDYLLEKSKDTTPKTVDLYRTSLERLCQRFETSADVTKRTVREWVTELRDEGLADKTLGRTFSAIRGYWAYLIDRGILSDESDPFAGAARPVEKGRARRGRVQPYKAFEPIDVVRLLRAAQSNDDEQLATLINLAMWSGCRIESLCSLRVADIDGDAFKVDDKTDAGDRWVPIHASLKRTLDRVSERSADGYVLSGLRPNKYGQRSGAIGKRFGRLKTKLGFCDRSFVFHSIRKTVVTQLQRAGVSEEVTMSIVGHENPSLTYGLYSAGPSIDQKREAIRHLSYPDL